MLSAIGTVRDSFIHVVAEARDKSPRAVHPDDEKVLSELSAVAQVDGKT